MSRGRHARSPKDLPPSGWKDVILRVHTSLVDNRLGMIAAGVAFYTLLALFPGLSALIALGGLFLLEPDQIVSQLAAVTQLLPPSAREVVLSQAQALANASTDDLGLAALLGLAFALFTATRGVGGLIVGLNIVYDEREERGLVALTALKLTLTVAMILGLLLALAITGVLPAALSLVQGERWVEIAITATSWLFLIVFVLTGLAVLFRFGPSRAKARWHWLSVGSVAASLVWLIASAGFALFVSNFGTYNQSFGSLAGVVVLMLWLWISAFIVLLGAALNAEIEAQTRIDSTVGTPKPMGERGATKADQLGRAYI
jgi:membrane protein